jgi:hypothetical protein
MKKLCILFLSLGTLIAGTTYAYEYTFVNKSDLDAEVQFQLAADLTTGNKTQNIKVLANKAASISIPEWWRAGLCINLTSIKIKFLVADGSIFKKPLPIYESNDFDYIVRTKELPANYATRDRVSLSAEDYVNKPGLDPGWAKDGWPVTFLCFNRTFDFAYHIKNNHPVIRVR